MSIINISQTVNELVDEALEVESKKSDEARAGKQKRLSPSSFDVCERKMWFNFQRTPKEKSIAGKIIRRFILGTDQEDHTTDLLRKAGFKISTRNDKGYQHGVFAKDGKFCGFVDGIITENPLDGLLETPCLFEHKIMKDSKFNEMKLKGLKSANEGYFDQVQLYMGSMNYIETLFVAYNTDNSELYTEIVKFDKDYYTKLDEKADKVIEAKDPTELKKDTKWCNWCDYKKTCASYDTEF